MPGPSGRYRDKVAEDRSADETSPGDVSPGTVDDVSHTDALPDDLDVSGYVGPYTFPDNNRRRIPGLLYLLIAACCVAAWFLTRDADPVLVNDGYLWAALALIAAGGYCFASGFDLVVDEQDALVIATRQVAFPVGHASAQMGWRGVRSRPTWRILCYSAEEPPTRRALVLVDGVDGEVVDWFAEDNPEDWTDLDGALADSAATGSDGDRRD